MIHTARHRGKPLHQPSYNFRDVPPAASGLFGSTLSEVKDRQHFVDSIAEFTLLCSEASRRRKQHSNEKKKSYSKPLSIEYIFDRIDTDDPMWGFMVRTDEPMSCTGRPSSVKASPQWRRGMLQGFITVTTFTTWKASFRFDSLHEEAFSWDDVGLDEERKKGVRKYDNDGKLAKELEETVHGGDPYLEGVVYPRIAEVSLLGGLGCGKQLLKLVIEQLERRRPTPTQNYDYLVLQATENSIPFYESMGFTRVGCIQGKSASPTGYTCSPVYKYVVQKDWEKPIEIAKKFNVDVLDLEFLNTPVWGSDFKKNVWLKKGSQVFVPCTDGKNSDEVVNASIQWHTAKEDETPRGIAMKYKVKYADFLKANQKRYPTLAGNSRLKAGTRIQISRFDIDDNDYKPYPHWTFPDDEIDEENNEPSYMMALKLNRKTGKAAEDTPVADSLKVDIQPYSPETNGVKEVLVEPKVSQIRANNKPKSIAKEPQKPKRPPSAFLLFSNHVRATMKSKLAGKSFTDSTKFISDMWKNLSDDKKSPFYKQFEESKPAYAEALKQFEQELATFRINNPQSSVQDTGADTSLLEQVVKLKSTKGTPGYASKYEYFYVLTYIPDLLWVHLIPMKKVGTFDESHPSAGRPIWMIVGENEGKEFDTSASICKVVSSKTMNNSADADDEQWDVLDDKLPLAPIFTLKKANDEVPRPVDKIEAKSSQLPSSKSTLMSPRATRGTVSQTPSSKQQSKTSTSILKTRTPLTQQKKMPNSSTKASPKNANETPQRTVKKKRHSDEHSTAKATNKSVTKKRPRSPSKTPRCSPAPKRTKPERTRQSTKSSIASRVIKGTCTVKVRVSGHIFDTLQSLEDVEVNVVTQETSTAQNVVNPKAVPGNLKVRAARKIVHSSPDDKTIRRSTATLHSSERKLAPIFVKKYTRSSSKPTSTTSANNPRDESPPQSPRRQKFSSPRRSPRAHQKSGTPELAIVSDDGLSERIGSRRKRLRVQ